MKPSQINADVELRDLLKGLPTVQSPTGAMLPVEVYIGADRPLTGVGDDFIDISYNGDPRSVDIAMGVIRGSLVVSLFSKLNSDGTIKRNRVQKILEQFEDMVHHKTSEHFCYVMDLTRFITPTTANQSSGYSVTRLNVEWHTR